MAACGYFYNSHTYDLTLKSMVLEKKLGHMATESGHLPSPVVLFKLFRFYFDTIAMILREVESKPGIFCFD